ncbi:uncharacterized protein [Cicer arietinum]|uniref:Uncharacterized protein LOC101495823 n=1 Tax=Cicer arietinum TaxID=3827 RepID=A0A1S2XFD6_CICAR|nr:uncharacterized protein LOC101495823 [Cicer arietinum]
MEEDVPQPPQMKQAADDIHDASAHVDDADESDDDADIDDQDQQTGFLGGPTVTRVLTQYEHHVARRLFITHGLKLKKFAKVLVPDPVEHWIRESGLMHLSSSYLTMADVGLISAFVERWHRETNSFHLPFGEMTITLDDVATLLHISPHGKFFDAPVNMNTNNAARAAHEYLGATWEEACAEISYNKCAQYRLQWLRDLYSRLIQNNQFECACWIYEHFPRICKRGDREAVHAHLPRACRWTAKHVVEGGLMAYRRRLDALLLEDVVFTPYDDDRANHPFVSILMFSGYLRCGGVSVPYFPERCLQ